MLGLPLDAVPIGIAVTQKGTFLQANAAFLRLFGYEAESEILGRSLLDHIAAPQRDLVRGINQERERTGSGPSEYESLGLRKDGSTFPIQIHVTTVPVAGGVGTLAFITDISERKKAEEALRESEHSVRAKLDAIHTPGGSIESLELADILNAPAIQEIMDHFHRLTDFGVTISDMNGKVLVGSGLQEICVQYHRAHPESCKNCFESDLILSEGVEPGGFKTYMCKNNLCHVVTPIYVGDRHMGNIFLGQFFFEDEPVDIELFKDQARRFGFDETRYLQAMARVPRWKREAVDTAMRYYSRLATLISELGFGSIKLAQALAEQQRTEESLKRQNAMLSSLLKMLPMGVFMVETPSGKPLVANEAALELLGRSMLPHASRENLLTVYEAYKSGSHAPYPPEEMPILLGMEGIASHVDDLLVVRPDGSEKLLEVFGTPVTDDEGTIWASLVSFFDITGRKQAEEQQQLLQAQLHQAQKMESLGALAGGVAHDMNNVLGAILGLASAHIEAQVPGSPAHKAFGTIIKAAERGGNMLKSLLNFARQNSAEEQDLDLNAILQEEVHLLERTTLSKVRLVMDLAPDLRLIRADAGALTHAFMNLCVNAVDAMPEKGTLTLRTRNLGMDWIEVQVRDTGTGMPKEILEKAMNPFFTTKEVGKGTGLGLSIVYSTVKAYQGEMELQSAPGCGTCVTIRFPAIDGRAQPFEPSGAYQTLPWLGSLNVLLVDDDELIQSSMLGMLENLGHQATLARSGEEALAMLGAGFRPDVVILDMNMPGLGGAATLPRLRSIRPRLPVLLATGRADQTAQDLVKAYAFVTLLSKPFGMKELQAHLDPYLG